MTESRSRGLPDHSPLQALGLLPWKRPVPVGWAGVICLLGLGLWGAARRRARALLAAEPGDLDLVTRVAVLELTAGGDRRTALDLLLDASARSPLDGRLRYWTARALALNAGTEGDGAPDFDRVLAELEVGLALRPDLFELWEAKGAVLLQLGRWGEALAALDPALAARPDRGYLWAARGACLRRLGRPEPAAAAYRRAIRLGGRGAEVWLGLAQVSLELGDLPGGRLAADRAGEARPVRTAQFWELAVVYDQLGLPLQAVGCLRSALALQPDSTPLRADLASALLRAGENEAAAALVDQSLTAAPADPALLNARGVLHMRRGELDAALAAFQTAIDRQGESAVLLANLAACHLQRGDFRRAATLYRLAGHWGPADPSHLLGLGAALERLGHPDAALACYDRAVHRSAAVSAG